MMIYVAEKKRFELLEVLPSRDFKSRALDHSAISPFAFPIGFEPMTT